MHLTGKIVKYDGAKGTVWRVRLDKGISPVTGKRDQPWHPEKYTSERAALKALASLISEANRGHYTDQNRMTLRELMIEWLKWCQSNNSVSTTTLEDYDSFVRNHVLPALGNERVQALTMPILQRWHDQMRADGKSPRLAQVCLQRVRSALGYAVSMQYVQFNAAIGVKASKAEHTEMQVWTPAEARRFLEHARTSMYHPYWDLALATGARRGELLGLRWEDINFKDGLLSIRRGVGPSKAGLVEDGTKTRRARVIDLDSDTLDMLRKHRITQVEERLQIKRGWGDERIVLATSIGTWINPANLTRVYDKIVAASKVTRIRMHDMRHTAATLMLVAGVPVKVVSERLGHTGIQITLDTYAHVLPGQNKAAAETLRKVLREG